MAVEFAGNNVKASSTMIPWPVVKGKPKRASINSFGYGGANAHAIIEEALPQDRSGHVSSYISSNDALSLDEDDAGGESARPYTLIVSAKDASLLNTNIQGLCDHLVNPRVKVSLADLAYTLVESRSRLWLSAFVTTRSTEIDAEDFVFAKKGTDAPRIGFVFTEPRSNEHIRQPGFSQPLGRCDPTEKPTKQYTDRYAERGQVSVPADHTFSADDLETIDFLLSDPEFLETMHHESPARLPASTPRDARRLGAIAAVGVPTPLPP
ncbi:Beta-ketoacyl synthase [Apiospora phragmitis]|uniref:Beta-ketoacyl synthase n=1 Tax=Apiospora phragmitis TaxID=2905665 RepID=A0ABR1TYM4_9PEZI